MRPRRASFYDVARSFYPEGAKWPCTHLVGHVLARAADLESTHKIGTDWWRLINVEGDDHYSAMHGAADVVQRMTGRAPKAVQLDGPITWTRLRLHLGQGKWYCVQGWRPSGSGHLFLLETGASDRDCRVLQSSTSRGMRINSTRLTEDSEIPDYWSTWTYLKQFQDGLGIVELW